MVQIALDMDTYWTGFKKNYLQGNNNYPKTITSAYYLLTDWKAESNSNDNKQANFFIATQGNASQCTQQRKTTYNNTIIYYNCGHTGHNANNCPNNNASRRQNPTTNVVPIKPVLFSR
jgi:hypothetical protein